jgi:hypothetical protein
MVRLLHRWAPLFYPIIINALGFTTVADIVPAGFILAFAMPPTPEIAKARFVFKAKPPVPSCSFASTQSATAAAHAVAAPSTGSAAPETKDASSEIRNKAALAISSGLPVRPIGFWRPRNWTSSSLSCPAVRC